MTKYMPKVGDERWEVEWCVDMPVDELGSAEVDRAKYKQHYCESESEAWEFAKSVYPQSVLGTVSITPCVFQAYEERDELLYPHVGYWEYTDDADYYEGEE